MQLVPGPLWKPVTFRKVSRKQHPVLKLRSQNLEDKGAPNSLKKGQGRSIYTDLEINMNTHLTSKQDTKRRHAYLACRQVCDGKVGGREEDYAKDRWRAQLEVNITQRRDTSSPWVLCNIKKLNKNIQWEFRAEKMKGNSRAKQTLWKILCTTEDLINKLETEVGEKSQS